MPSRKVMFSLSPLLCLLLASLFVCYSAVAENSDFDLDSNSDRTTPLNAHASNSGAENNWRPELAGRRQPLSESDKQIKEIVEKEPFINMQEEINWDFLNFPDEEDPDNDSNMWPWLAGFFAIFKGLAWFVEILLWLVPVLIILLLYRYRHVWLRLVQGKPLRKRKSALPETLFGLDVSEDSLPDDIASEAMALWESQQSRQAVSLLYRGALSFMLSEYDFQLSVGDTEQDCIEHIGTAINELVDDKAVDTNGSNQSTRLAHQQLQHIQRLTDVWILLAYGHRVPDEADFIALCHEWDTTYIRSEEGRG